MKEYVMRYENDVLQLLPDKMQELVRCKDCKWYDEQISMCDNCGLPREQTFFCADGNWNTEPSDQLRQDTP